MTLVKFKNSLPGFPFLMDSVMGKDFFDFVTNSADGTSLPAVNIRENSDAFIVEMAAPGMSREDFKIRLEDNTLIISSEKGTRQEENNTRGQYTRKEFSYQSFQRSFTLPRSAEREQITASYTDGILKITVPKKEEAKVKPPKEIQVL